MAVSEMRTIIAARKITTAGAKALFENAKDGAGITPAEKALLETLKADPTAFNSPGAKKVFDALFNDTFSPAPDPNKPRVFTQESRPSWTTTYFPMADYRGDKVGDKDNNLWAKGGAADEFDKILKKRGMEVGARDFELQPAIGWVVGKTSGGYMPAGDVDESDAEMNSGLDLNGDGKITANVKMNIVNSAGLIVSPGSSDNTSTNQSVSVSWWGHCDEVGAAGIMFREPVKAVTLDGATFTPIMVKGLLSMISQSQGGATEYVGTRNNARFDVVTLANGEVLQGRIDKEFRYDKKLVRVDGDDATFLPANMPAQFEITLADGTTKALKREQVKSVVRELQKENPMMFHTKMIEWLKEGRPAVMDKDDGEHLWNFNWHKLKDLNYENGKKPDWARDCDLNNGFNGKVQPGDEIVYVHRSVTLGGGANGDGSQENYRYWLAKRNGEVVNGNWAAGSDTPDFLWRPTQVPKFTGANPRNPFIDPAIVKEIYLLSLSDADARAEKTRLGIR